MKVPEDRRYSREHEWACPVGKRIRIGISEYGKSLLGEVRQVEPSTVGGEVEVGSLIVTVESTKSAAEVYAPVSGRIASVNHRLVEAPELLNGDPHGLGWMVEVAGDPSGLDTLLDARTHRMSVEQPISPDNHHGKRA